MSATPALCLPPLVPCIFRTDEHAPLVPAAIAWMSRTLAVLPPIAGAHAKKYLLDPTRYPDAFGDLYKFFHKTEHAFSGLKETNSHYLRATTILALMCWGAAQPWGKGCQLESVLLHWRYSVESNPQEHNASAAALLADFLPALDAAAGFFEPARRTGLRLRVYSYIERLMPWSNFSSFRKAMMHPVAIAMSSVAERHADKLDARWRNSLETATASMDEEEQQAWFLAMVESALRKSTKLSLAKMLPAEF